MGVPLRPLRRTCSWRRRSVAIQEGFFGLEEGGATSLPLLRRFAGGGGGASWSSSALLLFGGDLVELVASLPRT